MLETADTRRSEIQLAGFLLGQRDALYGVDRNARIDGERLGRFQLGNRGEGLDRIVRVCRANIDRGMRKR
jgi:hypothetical protein